MDKNFSSLPSFNHFSSRKDWEKACWEKITKSKEILDSLVTSYEQHNIVMRAAITDLVNSGKGSRQIARELNISRQTMSNIKKTTKGGVYKSYRERGKTERKKKAYSHNTSQNKRKHFGHYRRTKYGKVYMPY